MKLVIDAYALALDALLPGNRQKQDPTGRNLERFCRKGEKRW